jgi:hypothetical protein
MTALPVHLSHARRLQLFWVRHGWVDLGLAAALAMLWAEAGARHWVPLILTYVSPDARRTVYQILGTVAATMGGFVLTSISMLINLLRTPLTGVDRLLPAKDKRTVGEVFISVLPRLLVAFALAIVAILTDVGVAHGYWPLQLATVTAAANALLAIARVAWVLRRLLALANE